MLENNSTKIKEFLSKLSDFVDKELAPYESVDVDVTRGYQYAIVVDYKSLNIDKIETNSIEGVGENDYEDAMMVRNYVTDETYSWLEDKEFGLSLYTTKFEILEYFEENYEYYIEHGEMPW